MHYLGLPPEKVSSGSSYLSRMANNEPLLCITAVVTASACFFSAMISEEHAFAHTFDKAFVIRRMLRECQDAYRYYGVCQ